MINSMFNGTKVIKTRLMEIDGNTRNTTEKINQVPYVCPLSKITPTKDKNIVHK